MWWHAFHAHVYFFLLCLSKLTFYGVEIFFFPCLFTLYKPMNTCVVASCFYESATLIEPSYHGFLSWETHSHNLVHNSAKPRRCLRARLLCTGSADSNRSSSQQPPTSTTMVASIAAFDRSVSKAVFTTVSALIPRSFFMLLEEGGDGVFWLVSTALLCLYPGLPTYERAVATNLFGGLWIDLIFIGISKALFRRPRPAYNAADMHIIASVDRFSFPSGHASRCVVQALNTWPVIQHSNIRVGFVITFCFCCYHATNPTICAIILGWGLLTALSRAFMGRHYLGDVVAGLVLGLATTAVVTKVRTKVAPDTVHATSRVTTGLVCTAWCTGEHDCKCCSV